MILTRPLKWKRQKWKISAQVSKNKIVISWWLLINRKKVGQLDPPSLRKPIKVALDKRMLLREWLILTLKRCLNRLIIGPLWQDESNLVRKIIIRTVSRIVNLGLRGVFIWLILIKMKLQITVSKTPEKIVPSQLLHCLAQSTPEKRVTKLSKAKSKIKTNRSLIFPSKIEKVKMKVQNLAVLNRKLFWIILVVFWVSLILNLTPEFKTIRPNLTHHRSKHQVK